MERREKGRKKKNEGKIKGGERWGGKGRAGAAKGEERWRGRRRERMKNRKRRKGGK